jgi:hypothetical protein
MRLGASALFFDFAFPDRCFVNEILNVLPLPRLHASNGKSAGGSIALP